MSDTGGSCLCWVANRGRCGRAAAAAEPWAHHEAGPRVARPNDNASLQACDSLLESLHSLLLSTHTADDWYTYSDRATFPVGLAKTRPCAAAFQTTFENVPST